MATYREIHGKAIRDISADLSEDNQAGEIFYNSSTNTFRSIVQVDAFISGTAMPTAKSTYHRAGTMTAGLFCAGNASTGFTTSTEEWNGLGFSQGGAIGTALYSNTGFGTQTAGASAAGRPTNGSSGDTNATFEYDGSTWTSVNAANLAARTRQSFGIQTAGAMVGGFQQATTAYTNATEEYDGTNWTTVTAMPANASGSTCIGTQTAAIVGLGGAPTNVTTMLAYDGTNWTSSPSMNNARSAAGAGGTGATNTAGLVFGGAPYSPTASATAERWDGTSFSNSPASLSTARYGAGISDGNTNGIMVGGYQGTAFQSAVEEFNSSTNVITAAAFSSGGSMGNARYGGNFFGSGKSSQVAVGGQKAAVPPTANNITDSETYDGTSWSEGNNLGTARFNASGTGTETAGLVATGRNPAASPSPQVYYGNTEEYDGTSYSEVNDCPQAAYRRCGAGTQTATIIVGGLIPPAPTTDYSTTSNEYDGTNWSSGGAAPFKANYMDGVGVTTAAVVFGGQQDPAINNASYDYNGSSWTANSNMNISHGGQHLVAGTVTDAIIAGGGAPYAVAAQAETYDGTTFSTNATLGQGGQRGGKGSTTANAIGCGGYAPGYLTATEEYTAESTAANVKTITTS